ncbi:MAG: hypothetical protein ACKOB0_08005 [Chthoniobacterales bacterium]
MNFTDVIRLNSRVTLQQMLQREDFRERMDIAAGLVLSEALPVGLDRGCDDIDQSDRGFECGQLGVLEIASAETLFKLFESA